MPYEVRTRGSGLVLCAEKHVLFCCPGMSCNRNKEARALCGFQHHRNPVFFFLFSDPIIVGLCKYSHFRYLDPNLRHNFYSKNTIKNMLVYFDEKKTNISIKREQPFFFF